MTERIEMLLERVEMLPGEAHGESRRREDLIEQVVGAGHSREYADQIYDVAVEESCDPVLAVEVVLAGVGVRDLLPPSPADPEETQVEAAPAWIEVAPSPEEAERERHMRLTFRRLRSLTEERESLQDVVREFVRQPDVGDVEY